MSRKLDVRIRKLLKVMSPVHLADRLNVSVATVYRWRGGDTKRPLPSLLARVSRIEEEMKRKGAKTGFATGDLWILVLNVSAGAKGVRKTAMEFVAQKAQEISPNSDHHEATDIVRRWALTPGGE